MAVFIIWELYALTLVILNLQVNGDEKITTTSSTSHNPLDQTELPEEEVEFAIAEHWGPFTTMDFYYVNHQYIDYTDGQRCYEQYIKCLLSEVVQTPVCAIGAKDYGPINKGSYCDVYHENCIYRWRRYRILSYGKCYGDQDVAETFRRVLNMFRINVTSWF